MLRMLRRPLGVIGTAAAALGLVVASPATSFAASGNICGQSVADYGSVQIWGCIHYVEGETATVQPWAKMWFRNVNPANWQSCTVVVTLFVDNVQRSRVDQTCLAAAQAGIQDNPKNEWYGGNISTATTGHQYRAVVAWHGIYGTDNVGSHDNADSGNISFGELCCGLPDTPDVSGVNVPLPVPPVPVEYYI